MVRKYEHSPEWKSKRTDSKVLRARERLRRKERRAQFKLEDPEGYESMLAEERTKRAARGTRRRKPINPGTVSGRLRLLLKRARRRAISEGKDWDIQASDVFMPTHCPVLGIELTTEPGVRGGNRFSLDRSDNRKGYVKGNVRVISYRANIIKADATAAELRAVADYVEALEKLAEMTC